MPRRRPTDDERWHKIITGGNPAWVWQRRILRRLPGSIDRCNNCLAPFTGPSAPIMRAIGRSRYRRNPRFCGL